MSTNHESLEDKLQAAGSAMELIRSNEPRPLGGVPNIPDIETNWFEEQRAWRETCAFFNQSHHMSDVIIEGPDAQQVFSDVGTNSFEGFDVGKAKQLLMCNPKGYYIGDGILSHVDDQRYRLVAPGMGPHWIEYNVETGDYDVDIEIDPSSRARDGPPKSFRYEIMGPNTIDVMEQISDDATDDIPFFNLDTITLAGHEITALQHTMGGEGGIELWGPWEYAQDVKDAILEAGQDHGLRKLGWETYRSTACFSGWVHFPLPAAYDESMKEYREWRDASDFEGALAIAGSYYSDDVEDYYMTPTDVGLERNVSFDHDFVGREALEEKLEDPPRRLVMLEWSGEDVVDVYSSLFEDGSHHKFIKLLDPSWAGCHYDEVLNDGEHAGVSKWGVYNYNERAILSLASIDTSLADPGNEVTVVWGIPEGKERPPSVEPHTQKEIRATVHDIEAFRDQHR